VETRVVERSTALRPVEHTGEMGKREVARDSRHEGIEPLGDRPRLDEEGTELHLANLHGDPEAPQVALYELFEGIVAAPDREEGELQRVAVPAAPTVGAEPPPGILERTRSGALVAPGGGRVAQPVSRKRMREGRRHRRRPEAGQPLWMRPRSDGGATAPHAHIVEWGGPELKTRAYGNVAAESTARVGLALDQRRHAGLIPARDRGRCSSPANLVVGRPITATMSRPRRGARPS
jgi:hypothetical protein